MVHGQAGHTLVSNAVRRQTGFRYRRGGLLQRLRLHGATPPRYRATIRPPAAGWNTR
jgi:hypothetical protein